MIDYTVPSPVDETEVWKDVPGYEGLYQASDQGRIKSFWKKNPLIMHPRVSHKGYTEVNLYDRDRKIKTVLAHLIIAHVFLGDPPVFLEGRTEVNHKNGVKHDNRIENLEYVTPKGNKKHAREVLGIIPGHAIGSFRGEDSGHAKLTWEIVRIIRSEIATGTHRDVLAHRYGVCLSTISHIWNQRIWKE